MITSALLLAVGIALGWHYRSVMILFASGCLIVTYIAVGLVRRELGALELLVLFAHLVALQGGFLLAQYLRPRD
jgi:hypothetical protein